MVTRMFADDAHWQELAKRQGLRLPQHGTPLSPGGMERWLRKLGFTGSKYADFSGNQSLRSFITANPSWNLRAFVGMMLEQV